MNKEKNISEEKKVSNNWILSVVIVLLIVVLFILTIISYKKSSAPLLLWFRKSTCGPCKRFHPEWNKINDKTNWLNKIDYDANTAKGLFMSQNYNINSYPTIKLLYKNVINTYSGNRSAGDIITWCNQMTAHIDEIMK